MNNLVVEFELIDELVAAAAVRLLLEDSMSGEMGPLSVPLRVIGEGEGDELE